MFCCEACGATFAKRDKAENTPYLQISPAQLSLNEALVSITENVAIPGVFPSQPARAGGTYRVSLAQDVSILYGELQFQAAQPLSRVSKVLSRYFRFRPLQHRQRPEVHDVTVRRLLEQVAFLAMISGHRCLSAPSNQVDPHFASCPVLEAFVYWRKHLALLDQNVSHSMESDLQASYLGLCLSIAWYAQEQAAIAGIPMTPHALGEWLDPEFTHQSLSPDCDSTPQGLDHQFQFFAINCTGDPEWARRSRQFRSVSRRLISRMDQAEEADWLMD
ncbi:hypothetical protein OVA13_04360 [Pseudoxanthomonas sp. SL93]|uniref:hypothetical protein n=1 Tax=Pseudoxanthomonas sp. SL93 TaxID=2995142 RepID=UPI00226E81CA|nr:hypothetical protein [Pseudoxanthomonas sp. SL93]WAC64021.1 hypothetical protein OVA13_04360 [Pseudoxanthomonas sp. SL93]